MLSRSPSSSPPKPSEAWPRARRSQRGYFRTSYKNDEAAAFDLWYSKKRGHTITVIYFEARRGQDPIWRAVDEAGVATHDDKRLPSGAFAAMRRAAD